MTPEQIKLRDAIASTLYVNGYVAAETPSRRAADAVMRVINQPHPWATPERCGQRHITTESGETYTCSLAADHRAGFHQDIENSATWSRADDLVKLTPSMRDLGGTVDPAVPGDAVQRSALAGIARHIEDMRHVFAELLAATCTGCPIVAVSSNPEDGADIEPQPGCPVHGEVAELRRSLAWAASQHERIVLALGPEYTAPFGADAAQAAVNCIKTARGIDVVLREAGIEHPLGLRGVEDLASQRDGALEHVTEIREAVRAEIIATVHYGHTPTLDECTHHQCVGLRKAAAA